MPSPRGFDRFLERVGTSIADSRERAGLTQESAATRAGIDYKRWQRIERGAANVTLRTLYRVARALDVEPAQLIRSD